MNCKKSEKHIPLLAGNELSATKAAKVRAHLEKCEACLREANEIEGALKAAKTLARLEGAADWSESEWRHLLRSITATKIEKKSVWAGLSLKPVLAGSLALILIIAGTFLFLRKSPIQLNTQSALQAPSQNMVKPDGQNGKQNGQPITIISKESGLKIIWFYNKNFNGEGYGK